MGLDSHADTVVLGSNCIVLSYTTRECDVSPYTDAYDAIPNVSIVTGATAWTSPQTGETFILDFNEALWMGNVLSHSLLNPDQLCHYGTTVQDMFNNGDAYRHQRRGINDDEFILPLLATGTTIYFDSHTPSDKELNTCRHITLTSPSPWNPHNITFPSPSHRVEEVAQLVCDGLPSPTLTMISLPFHLTISLNALSAASWYTKFQWSTIQWRLCPSP